MKAISQEAAMRVYRQFGFRCRAVFFLGTALLFATAALGQGAYQAQVRGVVTDQSGAIVAQCHGHHHQRRHQYCRQQRTATIMDSTFLPVCAPPSTRSRRRQPGFRVTEEKECRSAGRPADQRRFHAASARRERDDGSHDRRLLCSTPRVRLWAPTSATNMCTNSLWPTATSLA